MQEELKMKLLYCFVGFLISANVVHAEEVAPSYRPPDGYVASEQTATAIAEAILVPIYGKERIEKQKPFRVNLRGSVWIVSGDPARNRREYVGGNFVIYISKITGEVTYLTHTK